MQDLSKRCFEHLYNTFTFLIDPRKSKIPSFDKEMYYIGDSGFLNGCQFVSNFSKSITLAWMKDGELLDVKSNWTNEWQGDSYLITLSKLTINNMNSTDSGKYTCILTFNTTKEILIGSSTVELVVRSKIFFSYRVFSLRLSNYIWS